MTIAVPGSYPAAATATELSSGAGARARWVALAVPALLFLLAAFLIRLPHLGDPAYHTDEEFYLFVGNRMLQGALPYVDVWDRKPIGLFLIYAAIRLLGGQGIYQYQVVATLFAAATAFIIHRISRPYAGAFGGAVAGLAYLLWIETVGGGGGQAPIFYNPLMAGAALAVLRASETDDPSACFRRGLIAMALVGLAMQIKYTALFEGVYFGALLSWEALRRSSSLVMAFRQAAMLATTALLPTGAAVAYYAALGQLRAFWFANFMSIGLRTSPRPRFLHLWLWQDGQHALILGTCCIAGLWHAHALGGSAGRRWSRIVGGWAIAAVVGFGSVGMYYDHYLLPVFVPLAVAAGPIFKRWPIGPVLAGIALWIPLQGIAYPDRASTLISQRRIDTLQRLLPANVQTKCIALFNAPPVLYELAHACTMTRFTFPDHLVSRVEANALGIDANKELARLLAQTPAALVVGHDPGNDLSERMSLIQTAEAKYYRRVGSVTFDEGAVDVWVSRDR